MPKADWKCGGLGGVADHPDDGVPAGDRERVAAASYSTRPTSWRSCVGVQVGQALVVGERGVGEHVSHDRKGDARSTRCATDVV